MDVPTPSEKVNVDYVVHSVCSKNIAFRVNVQDSENESLMREKLDAFCKQRNIDNMFVCEGGDILLSSEKKKIRLNSGTKSLQNCLGLSYEPTLLTRHKPLPYRFLESYFANGYDPTMIVYSIGTLFTEEAIRFAIRKSLTKTDTKRMNMEIMTNTTRKLLQEGIISVKEVGLIETNKRIVDNLTLVPNPDLHGSVTYTMKHYRSNADAIVYETKEFPDVEVEITCRPGKTEVKRKHTYIYSRRPGFGKSYVFANVFPETYNVHVVSDIKNWTDVNTKAQFLVFDEVCHDRKLQIGTLKAFTGGSAKGASGPRKSFGDSYLPRTDVQVIMMGNESLYEVYGEWNSTIQRRVMSRERTLQLEERFTIICLDGDVALDKRAAMDPKDWTQEEFNEEVKALFVEPEDVSLQPKTPKQRVNRCLATTTNALQLFRARNGKDFDDMFTSYLAKQIVDNSTVYFPTRVAVKIVARAAIAVGKRRLKLTRKMYVKEGQTRRTWALSSYVEDDVDSDDMDGMNSEDSSSSEEFGGKKDCERQRRLLMGMGW